MGLAFSTPRPHRDAITEASFFLHELCREHSHFSLARLFFGSSTLCCWSFLSILFFTSNDLLFPLILCLRLDLVLSTTMSDPEPSAVAFSSSPPSTQASDSAAAASSYAFLIHSQKTLTQNLPPRVDNKLLARQKRRRTRYVELTVLYPGGYQLQLHECS